MTHQRFYALATLIARNAAIWSHEGLIGSLSPMDEEIYPDAPTRFCDEIQRVIDRIRSENGSKP